LARIKARKFVPKPDQYAWTFGGVDPVLRVEPGSVLELWTEDAFAGNVKSTNDLPSKVLEYPYVNPQTGPFYVEGAEPGDTLAIHFVKVEPARRWAASTTIPLFGSLTGTKYTATLQDPLPERVWMYDVDVQNRVVRFQARDSKYSVDLPLKPFHGTVGVAPAASEVRNVLVPEAFGGNMDTPEMRAGATVYLGVNVKGGLFSIGDGHYCQGEGEVCGVAVEGAMDTVLTVDLLKGKYCDWPRLEDDDYVMAVGSYRPLEDAFRIAYTEMVRWVSADYGLSVMDSYQLVSQVSETPLANVVDPNYSVVSKIPKKFLPARKNLMGGLHHRLSSVARAYLGDRAL
jgi:acetamidase/formamidase